MILTHLWNLNGFWVYVDKVTCVRLQTCCFYSETYSLCQYYRKQTALLRNLGFALCCSLRQEVFTFHKYWTVFELVWSSHFVPHYKQGELNVLKLQLLKCTIATWFKKTVQNRLIENDTAWTELFLILGMLKALAGLVVWFVTNQRRFWKGQLECFHFNCCYWHEILTAKVDHRAQKCITPVYCLWCFDPMLGEEKGNKKFCLALAWKIHSDLPHAPLGSTYFTWRQHS